MKDKHAFVVMVKDKWWHEFLRLHDKGKQVQSYVQRWTAPPKQAFQILFYVIKPVGEMAGHAEFIERKVGEPEELWTAHGDESVLPTKEQYLEFVGGKPRIAFVRFKNLQRASQPISLNNLRMALGMDRLARGGFYVAEETARTLVELMK